MTAPSFTADACRSAAAIWLTDGSEAHRDFAPVLEAMADRFEARAQAAQRGEQRDLFGENT